MPDSKNGFQPNPETGEIHIRISFAGGAGRYEGRGRRFGRLRTRHVCLDVFGGADHLSDQAAIVEAKVALHDYVGCDPHPDRIRDAGIFRGCVRDDGRTAEQRAENRDQIRDDRGDCRPDQPIDVGMGVVGSYLVRDGRKERGVPSGARRAMRARPVPATPLVTPHVRDGVSVRRDRDLRRRHAARHGVASGLITTSPIVMK